MNIEYLPNNITMKDSPLWWHKQGLTQTVTGYGLKLTTRYKVAFKGRWYRVYATCISNVASHWIMSQGRKIHLQTYHILKYTP